jgi:ankyrin repeat protein
MFGALLKARASIETKDNIGIAPLLWAAANDHGKSVGKLLKAGSTIKK